MKYLAIVLGLCGLAACSKKDTVQPAAGSQNEPITCEFGQTSFNLSKRSAVDEELAGKGKPPKFNWGNVSGGGGSSTPAVILLDFDGHVVSGTAWNTFSEINCMPANLTYEAMTSVFNRIANDYSPFNVIVTTDESVFSNATPTRRMRVIFTETWEWFGQAGGTAFLGSFGMSAENPCFVFTSLLNYNEKMIGEAGAHEMGHTLGLQHQAVYNGTTMTSQYNYGVGSGETSWAPIMGCGYYKNVTTWHNGPTTSGYNSFQDEISMITAKLGTIADEYNNNTTNATTLTGTKNGLINSSTDVDYFSVNTSAGGNVSLVPFNVASPNSGANLDLVLKVYNSQGQLLQTVNDPAVLNASVPVGAGQYFISISVAANSYAAVYGMEAKYSVSLN
jgi:hypothetical protein